MRVVSGAGERRYHTGNAGEDRLVTPRFPRYRYRDRMSEVLLQPRWAGRFGNRMFQYAFGATFARLTGRDYFLPSEWEGTRLFKAQPHASSTTPRSSARWPSPEEGGRDNRPGMRSFAASTLTRSLRRGPRDGSLRDAWPPTLLCERVRLQCDHFRGHVAASPAAIVRVQRRGDQPQSVQTLRRHAGPVRRRPLTARRYRRPGIQQRTRAGLFGHSRRKRTTARSRSLAMRRTRSSGCPTTTPANGTSAGSSDAAATGPIRPDRNT